MVKQNFENREISKACENLFGNKENHLEKITDRNQSQKSREKFKQLQEKIFGTFKEEDKIEINKSDKILFRTRTVKWIEVENNENNKQIESIC